jgi:hypothetical protein
VLGNLAANRRPSANNPPTTSSSLNLAPNRLNSLAGRRPSPNSAQQPYNHPQPQPLRTDYRHNSDGNHNYNYMPASNTPPSFNYNCPHNQQKPLSNAPYPLPPPPMGYGQGLPPSNPTSRLPQLANNCPPPSPAPPPNADSSDLYPLFLVVPIPPIPAVCRNPNSAPPSSTRTIVPLTPTPSR